MRTAVLLASAALVSSACEQGLPEVTPELGERVAQIAEPASAELLRTLVGQLTAALDEGGTSQAMELCSNEAIPLTRMVEAGLEGPLSLKRTSFRYRNPENAPDEADEAALLHFERAIQDQGQAPASYVQRVSTGELRYYRPLFVGEVCLGCHGDLDTIDPQVRRVLSERYPEDLATGYAAGAFRGLVRVSMPETLVEPGGA